MKLSVVILVGALVGCGTVAAAMAEEFVLASPFDLVLGTTNYAARLGKALQDTSSALYDPETKVTTTNRSAMAWVKLVRPYRMATSVLLRFQGDTYELAEYSLNLGQNNRFEGKLTIDECRKLIAEVAAEISKRFGVTMEGSTANPGLTDMEIDAKIGTMKDGENHRWRSFSFLNLNGCGEREGVGVGYGLAAMVDRRKRCSVGLHVYISRRPSAAREKKRLPQSIPGLVSTEEQAKGHAAAAGLRETLGRLFGLDFDSAETESVPAHGWTALTNGVGGLTESRVQCSSGMAFYQIPLITYSARRAFPGDVDESELKRVAEEIRTVIEAAYGAKIPEVDGKEGTAKIAEVLGDGVPTFGDTRALFGFDKTVTFAGKVGDLAVEISYALPRYEKEGDGYRLVRRGGVVVTLVQSPIVTPAKTL